MVYELQDTAKVEALFAGWQETLIYSCLQKVMGRIWVTDRENPRSAFAFVGCFGFFAGLPDRELVRHKPRGFVIMVPQNEAWAALIESCYPSAKRITRYAIKKDTRFDTEMLRQEAPDKRNFASTSSIALSEMKPYLSLSSPTIYTLFSG